MATVSSHILDSVNGKSAAGIRCLLTRVDGDAPRQVVFDIRADSEGRIAETIKLEASDLGVDYELEIYAAEYFADRGLALESMVKRVVIRFTMDDAQKRYHLPVMLSPHSYSTWWSS